MAYTLSKEFYVYLYYDHRNNNTPIYVGKGFGDRRFAHVKSSRRTHLSNLLRRMAADGFEIVAGVVNCPDEEFAFLLEMELIARYGRRDRKNGTLLNLTDGGEGECGRVFSAEHLKNMKGKTGHPWSAASRAKLAATNTGRKRSAEARANMRAAQARQIGKPSPMKGKKYPESHGAKISAAKLGKTRPPVSEETRRKLSASAKIDWAKRKAKVLSCIHPST